MPSTAINKVREFWSAQASRENQPTIEEMRYGDSYWAALTAEPTDITYAHDTVGGISGLWAIPKGCRWDHILLCFHGGGFAMGSKYSHRKMYGHIAKAIGCRALLIDYRLIPEHQHPAQVNDALAAYRGLLELGVSPTKVLFCGDSSGGGLTISTQLLARQTGLPLPAGAMTISAWTDMALTGSSYDENREKDLVFRREMVGGLVAMLLGPDPDLTDPLASPIRGDLSGLPPIYLQVGADETLLDDTVVFSRNADDAGVEVKVDIFPEMLHTFQMAAGNAPEADDAVNRLGEWGRRTLGLSA